jgi:PAS domain-containing protein
MSDGRDPFREGWAEGRTVPVAARARACVWCQRELGAAEGGPLSTAPAVCDSCAAVLTSEDREPLATFIEKVSAPLLVLSWDATVVMANARARVYLGKAVDDIAGRPSGDVIQCVNASEPEGCGRTIHCSGCTLRRSVQHTHETGEPLHVHSYHDVRTPAGIRTAWLEIATERAGELVLLRVSQVGFERRA